ncbi:UDP-glucose 4-epimerase GalE [Histomonas meleagridis]|uniref:UDP-glucose 4-epimerase GalE n=1 Tax=Histomonas meleagridis TaxID=135588 RepID=UPI003559ECD9|nr:UDP-glucose 4-epimerase GalE [Histomonas meleagridis]KAH0800174.1 UDP-glucose 4-epimerase GalE [Histomonas meleagridis]
MSILVTGGAGYIGSHTVVELLNAGKQVIIIDNFVNSKPDVLDKIKLITKKDFKFYQVDLLNREDIDKVFAENQIDAVIHFAGLKAVGESMRLPILYYHNNITGTLHLLQVMMKYNVKRIVFSSSATVYTLNAHPPCKETDPLATTNPYGSTKLFIENILTDLYNSDNEWSVVLLRYFNPIGAHPSGLIGENPNGIPNNLIPYVAQVAIGKLPYLKIYGNDYDTPDGTGVRDYIHVVDLAEGHICALDYSMKHKGVEAVNLGTGSGSSVFDVVHAFEKASGVKINYQIVGRRPGDVAIYYSDTSKALKLFGWKAKYDLNKMCEDTWNFIKRVKEEEQ